MVSGIELSTPELMFLALTVRVQVNYRDHEPTVHWAVDRNREEPSSVRLG